MADNLSDYFQRATGARSVRAIALRAGLEPSTLNRQLTGATTLAVETVVTICRAFDLDLADAFVAAGYITEEEADRLGARVALSAFSDLELAREIVVRIENATASEDLTGDLPIPINVRGAGQDDLLAVASERTDDDETDEGYE
ncbi:hypothetical protein D8M34_06130 [Microbacterium sp. HSID17254]|uniref:helix-turn-helix domain-containing protein n=1 Tax=Microbacterium sp. HSID17254 TaxID=2419509 RepID=UPI000F89A492|nr:helix-turn-helix domain-containing protein [Microbacterium sp. HSID17254]RUQ07046.1 hypothetical protein D8M34_06130 [Microbacterium sp. HSID17254]